MSERGGKHQYLATLVVNMYMVGMGTFRDWSETQYQIYLHRSQYADYNPQQYRPIAWPMSLFLFGAIIGSIFFGFITMKFGRKIPLLSVSVPLIIGCLINVFVHEYGYYQISMALVGLFSGGVCIIAPLFLLEIANDRFRGAMLTSLILSTCLGELFAIGAYSAFRNNDFILLFVIAITMTANILLHRFIPDAPLSLVKRKKFTEAEESIRFYKNIRETDENQLDTFKQEFDRIKNAAADEDSDMNQMVSLRFDDFKTQNARKALAIGIVLVVLSACHAAGHIKSDMVLVLNTFPLHIRTLGGRLTVLIVEVLSTYAAMQLVDRIGRKILIIVSAVATSLALIIYTIHSLIDFPNNTRDFMDLIAMISSVLAVFFSSLGIQSLTFTVSTEIMPEKIKDVGVIICGAFYWIFSYAFMEIFALIVEENAGNPITAVISLAGAIIIYLWMPETKGKSRQEIMKSL